MRSIWFLPQPSCRLAVDRPTEKEAFQPAKLKKNPIATKIKKTASEL